MRLVDNESFYKLFNYKDVKIYIGHGVKTNGPVEISLKFNLPIIGHAFDLRGVSV